MTDEDKSLEIQFFSMKQKFCPKCGKETEELIDGLCEKCFRKEKEVAQIPREVDIEVCQYCGRVEVGEKWIDTSLEEAVKQKIENSVEPKLSGEVEIKIEVEGQEEVKVEVSGEENGVEMSKEKTVELKVDKGICETCSSRISGYYEAVVQIRGYGGKVRRAMELAGKVMKKSRNRKAFASDVKEVENGVDIFVGSNSVAKKMVRKLSSEFEVERKESKTLYGEEEGEKKYRSTYLARIVGNAG